MIKLLFRLMRRSGLLDLIIDYSIQKSKKQDELNQINYYHEVALIETDVKFLGKSKIGNLQNIKNNIHIKKNAVINECELLIFKFGGKIEVGEYSFIGPGTRVWSAVNIKIGDRVFISYNVNIHDSNSHDSNSKIRHLQFLEFLENGFHPKSNYNEKPIVIGNDVWIGFNCTISKGVTIGEGAIVGHGSFVKEDVPPFTVVAGNPAKEISRTK